jgi:predicted GNAT family N-acyltransferase
MDILKVTRADSEAVKELISAVSEVDVLPLFSADGQLEYKNRVLPDIQTTMDENRFFAVKAVLGAELTGFAALRDGNYLTHLFVAKSAQGTGLGSRLLNTVLDSTSAKQISLRSSLNAADFYRRHGFTATGEEAEFNGIRFIPMMLIRD